MARMAFSTFVLFACGVAASSRATSVSTDTSILISSDSRHVPWLQPSSWQPAHSGVTELDALLKLRASPSRWVTVYLLALPTNATALDSAETRAFLRLALNTFLTYRQVKVSEVSALGGGGEEARKGGQLDQDLVVRLAAARDCKREPDLYGRNSTHSLPRRAPQAPM